METANAALVPPPVERLFHNRGDREYTPPANSWYRGKYLWDQLQSAMAYACYGFPLDAVQEIRSVLSDQRPDGFVANFRIDPTDRRFNPERFTFMEPNVGSDYSQPPLFASAVAETYHSFLAQGSYEQGLSFIRETYPQLKKAYGYYRDTRENSDENPLIGIIHMCESGRDSDHTFDSVKPRLRRSGEKTSRLIDLANAPLDYIGALALSIKNRRVGWDPREIKKYFWVNDVMFNCMYADNLSIMGDLAEILGERKDAGAFRELSEKVEAQILVQMWDPDARKGEGAFYALDKNGEHIKEVSISNLYPLLLPNLPADQLASCLRLIDTGFNTSYPLPTIATDSPNYDPHYQEKPIMWRGPVWIWMNHWIANGLERQARRQELSPNHRAKCTSLALWIRESSAKLTSIGFWEFYNPITGEPYRTPNFSGSALGYLGGIVLQHTLKPVTGHGREGH